MQKSIRQSMSWLHNWTGLLFGWLLFIIFVTGSLTYYRHELNLWMQPSLTQMSVNQDTAIRSAYEYLQTEAHDAQSWFIGVANNQSPVNQVYWQKADGSFDSKTLDAGTGQELKLTATQGGDFFYRFHYQLYGFPYLIGRLIVTVAALLMLITLISGIITHKKIFTDFFTLRTFKGPRSYLDVHNVTSVIALPFFLTISFTGLMIFFYILLPNGMKQLYPDSPYQYFEDIRFNPTTPIANPSELAEQSMLPISYFLNQAYQTWPNASIANITVKYPNTEQARMIWTEKQDHSITRNQQTLIFNGNNGEILENNRNNSAVAVLNNGIFGLHLAHFAQPFLRLALFFSGILGAVMIATGLLLWSLKRELQRKTNRFHLGHYLVERLNITAMLGLPIAVLAYLYANRFLHLNLITVNYEVMAFFSTWLISLLFALCTPKKYLWQSFLKYFIVLAICLPLLDLYLGFNLDLIQSFDSLWHFLKVDLMIWIFSLFAYFLHRYIDPMQQKIATKFKNKLERNG